MELYTGKCPFCYHYWVNAPITDFLAHLQKIHAPNPTVTSTPEPLAEPNTGPKCKVSSCNNRGKDVDLNTGFCIALHNNTNGNPEPVVELGATTINGLPLARETPKKVHPAHATVLDYWIKQAREDIDARSKDGFGFVALSAQLLEPYANGLKTELEKEGVEVEVKPSGKIGASGRPTFTVTIFW